MKPEMIALRTEYATEELLWLKAGAPAGKEPYRNYEFIPTGSNKWFPCMFPPSWRARDYRKKPKIILINGMEVPEPIREEPRNGEQVWVAALEGCYRLQYSSSIHFRDRFKAGLLHKTHEAAATHAIALKSFTTTE